MARREGQIKDDRKGKKREKYKQTQKSSTEDKNRGEKGKKERKKRERCCKLGYKQKKKARRTRKETCKERKKEESLLSNGVNFNLIRIDPNNKHLNFFKPRSKRLDHFTNKKSVALQLIAT